MITVAYERWSFTRVFNHEASSAKILGVLDRWSGLGGGCKWRQPRPQGAQEKRPGDEVEMEVRLNNKYIYCFQKQERKVSPPIVNGQKKPQTSRRPIAAGGKGTFSKRKDVDIGDTDGGLINWD